MANLQRGGVFRIGHAQENRRRSIKSDEKWLVAVSRSLACLVVQLFTCRPKRIRQYSTALMLGRDIAEVHGGLFGVWRWERKL